MVHIIRALERGSERPLRLRDFIRKPRLCEQKTGMRMPLYIGDTDSGIQPMHSGSAGRADRSLPCGQHAGGGGVAAHRRRCALRLIINNEPPMVDLAVGPLA